MGRDFESSRGFFELLGPVVAREHHSSAVSIAITATALRLHSLWRESQNVSNPSMRPNETLRLALSRLQHALSDPCEMKTPKTVLAALMLQFDETLSAVWDGRQPNNTHHDGAVALFMSQGHRSSHTTYSRHLVSNILHSEVASAICKGRLVPLHIRSWIQDEDIPPTPSFTLDLIGIEVARVQHQFGRVIQQVRQTAASPHNVETLWSDIRSISEDLLGWVNTLPYEWQPVSLPQRNVSPPIVTYMGRCDAYPSIQIASIWNTWRCYRLMLLKMALVVLHLEPQAALLFELPRASEAFSVDQTATFIGKSIQELVDLICYSVPFHLGSSQGRASMHTFQDESIVYPSYHDLPQSEEKYVMYRAGDNYLTVEDHRRHAIVQGPWHVVSPLGYLRRLLSSEFGRVLTEVLRPGQVDWIYEQLVRGTSILALTPKPENGTGSKTPMLI